MLLYSLDLVLSIGTIKNFKDFKKLDKFLFDHYNKAYGNTSIN